MRPYEKTRPGRDLILILGVTVLSASPAVAQTGIAGTVHNLAATGPGTIRARTEAQICIFCHAPHNTSGKRPLWNHEFSVASYRIYQSSTLDARPGQPTGSSKLCLSCHDGTIALGSVFNRAVNIPMVGGDRMPAGLSNLGTDLSDDHPISFAYTASLAAADPQLLDPSQRPAELKLDPEKRVQCITCHDAHDNRFGKFLVKSDLGGALCTSCHRMNGWSACSHPSSGAHVSGTPSAGWPYATVAQNACRSCHRPHTAGGRERLRLFANEEDNCLDCHNGQVAKKDILAEIGKREAHDPRRYLDKHDPVETRPGTNPHVECSDCHNPHAVKPPEPPGGYIPIGATLTLVRGIDAGGSPVQAARFEYEVCFRCHADAPVNVPGKITRQSHTGNLRLKFASTNPSYHPVIAAVASSDTVSLTPAVPAGSKLRCTDCHGNDAGPGAGGSGPAGPHGSIYDFLLERNDATADYTKESATAYALCYKCHRRTSILNDESFRKHKKHIVKEDTPCSVCHDAHGVRLLPGTGDHTHLINFDTTVVFPEPRSGKLEFRDLGRFRGSCTLLCHGKRHRDQQYRP